MKKRLLSTLLMLCMVLTLLPPGTAWAVDDGTPYEAGAPAGKNYNYTISTAKQLQAR